MLIIQAKLGGGINGDGIFDFGKILLKKVSGLAQKASKMINSSVGKKTIKALKRAAESDVGRELQQQAAKKVKEKVNEILPSEVKNVVYSDLGQKILSQASDTAFEKLGIKRKKPSKKTVAKRKRKGGAIVYPQHLVEQFGSGLVLE